LQSKRATRTFSDALDIPSVQPLRSAFSRRRGGVPFTRPGVMTKSFTFNQPVFHRAGAVAALLALALFAPPVARAGCSHFVTSRTDPGRLFAPIEPLMQDLSRRSEAPRGPADPRPCSGAFCSGQPAVPAVPAGVFGGVLNAWACLTAVPGLASRVDSFLSPATDELHPTRRAIAVFHPPRFLPSA
jgi:hypothetical protein